MSEFNIQTAELDGGIVRFDVEGFLDAHTFERMQRAIDGRFEQGQHRLVINLEHVRYISSAGAGVFIGATHTAQENDGNIVFLNPTDNVKEVFDLLGLSRIFTFADSEELAVSSFA